MVVYWFDCRQVFLHLFRFACNLIVESMVCYFLSVKENIECQDWLEEADLEMVGPVSLPVEWLAVVKAVVGDSEVRASAAEDVESNPIESKTVQ